MRLGIFGGTFNPIHTGHLRAAEEVRYRCMLDRIIFIPSGSPPLKTAGLAEAVHREAMLNYPKAEDQAMQDRLKLRKEQSGMAQRDDIRSFVDYIDADEKRL